MLCDDVPEGAKEVTEDQDEENETEHTEDIHEVDLIHDLVVVLLHWLHAWILLDTVIETAAVQFLQKALELLSVQQEKHFVETEQAQ